MVVPEMSLVVVALFLSSAAAFTQFNDGEYYSAHYDPNNKQQPWTITPGRGGIAYGFYRTSGNVTGWDVFEVTTDGTSDDTLQAYAAGFLEGALSAEYEYEWFLNHNLTVDQTVTDFIMANDKWVLSMVENPPAGEATFWTHVGLVYQQFNGVMAGYNQYAGAEEQLTLVDWTMYFRYYELSDYQCAVGECQPAQTLSEVRRRGHCSVLVKVLPDLSNVFASHDTWGSYFSMLRTYKHMNTPFKSVPIAAPAVSFSSHPGFFVSGDDFYITSQNLAVSETTNQVFNLQLYQNVTTKTVPYWVRNVVANRMATDGPSWIAAFSMYNSGTYNNQFQIVDFKLFTPGQPLQNGTLWITEQLPGFMTSGDVTDILRKQGYFPSYNVPYFEWVYNMSGYPAYIQSMGQELSYTNCSRANIFRRDHNKVVDMASMQAMMRYNEWQTDPFSGGDACNSISARCDLNPPGNDPPQPFGGYDSKVTDAFMSSSRSSFAVCGPSWDAQPVFAWTNQWQAYNHFGMPRIFDFEFQPMKPSDV